MKIHLSALGPDLPVHPGTGLTALGLRRNGAPIWPVRGGASDDDQGDGDDDTDTQDDADKPDGLGGAGQRALDAMKAELKAAREELGELRAAVGDKRGKDAVSTRLQQEREARKALEARLDEADTRATVKIVRAEVRAAATGRLADPADALAFLDLAKFTVDEHGEVVGGGIDKAIDDLLKKKPHLAAMGTADSGRQESRSPRPDRSQGARGGAQASAAEKANRRLERMGLRQPTT